MAGVGKGRMARGLFFVFSSVGLASWFVDMSRQLLSLHSETGVTT